MNNLSLQYCCCTAWEEDKKKMVNKEPMSSDAGSLSETVIPTHDKPCDRENTEASNFSHYSGFPPLPPPPQEYQYYRHKTQHLAEPTEDRMGTLHNAIVASEQQPVPSSSQTSSDRVRRPEPGLNSNQSAAVRFVPRTTHLENRKRRMEKETEHSLTNFTRKTAPLIGPKLPEPPKVDMEDESLNTTVSLIRGTMKKVV